MYIVVFGGTGGVGETKTKGEVRWHQVQESIDVGRDLIDRDWRRQKTCLSVLVVGWCWDGDDVVARFG